MRSHSFTLCLCFATLLLGAQASAQDSRPTAAGAAKSAPPASTQKSGARPVRGPLPDPSLLDGSTQPAEKKSEYGMLGEFEIPGDENAKSGKVGGPQRPPDQPQGINVSLPMPLGIPGMSGGGAGQGGLPGLPPLAMPQGGAGGASDPSQSGKPPSGATAGGGPAGGPNDPNAKADGIQVSELKTDESAGPAGQNGIPSTGVQKPQPVAIGDPTRQIKPAANAPGVVGAQAATAGNAQQMEKATGGGGKGGSGDGNRGVEKGRVMPAGL